MGSGMKAFRRITYLYNDGHGHHPGAVPLAVQTQSSGLIAGNLATVVIGGLLTSMLLTLVVVPVIYSLFTGLRRRVTGGGALATVPVVERATTTRGARTPERVAFTTES